MKKNIYPQYNNTVIILTNGAIYKIRLKLNQKKLKLFMDFKAHSLWNPKLQYNFFDKKSQVAKFNKRFLS